MHRFERIWQERLKENFREKGNDRVRELLHDTDLCEPGFSSGLLKELKAETGDKAAAEAMMAVSCEYPQAELDEIKDEYEKTKDIKLAHAMLQKKFDYFLKEVMLLDQKLIEEIQKRKWGLAGKLEGNTITVAKIPKSSFIYEYFAEKDPEKRRNLYCHCPRIRDFIGKEDIDPVYCYCGAGFYKKIWEYITGKQTSIKMSKSVLKGDDHCQFVIDIIE